MSEEQRKDPASAQDAQYEMTVSLNVLDHLGINLYSSVPSVLAEAVANSWDADAEAVEITLNQDDLEIEIIDDGHGMDKDAVNDRYLHVGYRRRQNEDGGGKTPKGRDVMGRKGIGKLSLFAIAKTVEVFTTDGEDRNAFRMNVDEIRTEITSNQNGNESEESSRYEPTPLENFPEKKLLSDTGTIIRLTDLKKDHIYNTEGALRKRLARRFSVIGSKYDFEVRVNGEKIAITDRDYFHKINALWTFDDGSDYGDDDKTYADYCDDLVEEPTKLDNTTEGGWNINGWIGAVERPKDLEVAYGGEKDDLNKITLLVRGKMAKENLLDDFHDSGFYTSYLVGEIIADHLDLTDYEDIATTARDDMIQDDDRWQDLLNFLEEKMIQIRDQWDEIRDKQGTDKALQLEVIQEWYNRLENERSREKAEQLFGKINRIATDSEEERRQLFKYGVLAFERLRYKDNLSKLDGLEPGDLAAIDEVFVDLNDLEAALYYQIVSQRVEVIEELRRAINENQLEKVLQKHLFDNLWLLDPGWERATGSEFMEGEISSEWEGELPEDLTDSEKRGRVDIKYRKTTGRHVIIELKRPERRVETPELMSQGDKYKRALNKVLKQRGKEGEPVEVVLIVGEEPTDWVDNIDEEKKRNSLKEQDMRLFHYKELLQDAQNRYENYLNEQKRVGEIGTIIDKIETADLT